MRTTMTIDRIDRTGRGRAMPIGLSGYPARPGQNGMVLEVVLVVLLVLLLASTALFRSIDTTSSISANLAFKADANNRAQLAFDQILSWLKKPENYTEYIKLGENCVTCNYSARMLETNAKGIPLVLATDPAAFDGTYSYKPPNTAQMDASGMKVRYLIERLCTRTGPPMEEFCTMDSSGSPEGGNIGKRSIDLPPKPMLRVTIRVDGPRNTVAFTQATVTP